MSETLTLDLDPAIIEEHNRMAQQHHEIIVGNIGTVYVGPTRHLAHAKFTEYMEQSIIGYGRAAHESVTWMTDGEIVEEHIGEQEHHDDHDDA